jgi:DNA-binding IclR family transcriptional regulator
VPVDLTETDHRILDALAEGRCTTGYLADELDRSRQHVHNRLAVLLAAEYVRKVHDGTALYELVEDPRDASRG